MENYYTHHSGKYGGYRQQLTKVTNVCQSLNLHKKTCSLWPSLLREADLNNFLNSFNLKQTKKININQLYPKTQRFIILL